MMDKHQLSSRLAILAMILSVAACSGGAPSPPAPDGLPEGPGLSGTLVGEDEAPLAYVNVMACRREVCYYTDTDRTGRFLFLFDMPGDFLIKTTEDLASRPRRSSPMVPATVAGTEIIDIGNVYAPALGEDVAVEADGTVEAGDGLTLLFGPAENPGVVAARRIPARMIPTYPGLPAGRILAVYAVHPLGWHRDSPIGVRVELDGRSGVLFQTIDELDGQLSDPVPGTKLGNAFETEAESGITSLTHLVVVHDD